MAYIPTGLIANILSWLPVKSLLRFRCVSKPWRDLIDDRHFIKSHIDRSIKSKNKLRVIIWYDDIYSLPFDSLDGDIVELDWPFKYSVDKTKFLGCCDGLVCLGIGQENAAIWNPSTRKYRKLPVAPIELPENSHYEQNILFAIGYDSITDDYKAVRIVNRLNFNSEVRVYSMKLNSWRRVRDIPREHRVLGWPGGLSVLGCGDLHWISAGYSIVAFHLAAEEHRLLPGLEFVNIHNVWILGELVGCLCIFDIEFGLCTDAWVMKDYGVKESWSLMFSISQHWPCLFDMAVPLTYSKSDGKVLMVIDGERFVV